MSYYDDPIPYVLPDEDDLFGEEVEVQEIEISRKTFAEADERCIFFYAFHKGSYDCDVIVRKVREGQVYWGLNDEQFHASSPEELAVLRWMLDVADRMMENFEAYWGTSPYYWVLPPCPDGWKVVIK